MIKKSDKIYIAGHRGMVGSACWRALEAEGYTNLIGKSSKELDLRDQMRLRYSLDLKSLLQSLTQLRKLVGFYLMIRIHMNF